ncbi:helix-turn-helix domain-containing protein [Chitinophaga nivalis]|uniref:Chromosomal replication initiator DnaA C-terminal domain-containing protein n=1 Tax=Chitinophaga nivalis TaxID=2991709 RepID=A0ABT3IFY9_9BACT|nr:helix-turn-helix domain-containing protein [Chitinophaga nivalis]MCW3467629.1 hypothetical protein [Chitinophaga nivalis]MCW3482679.1 hypothetical protein [Chitinophaga nivalis]
MHLSIRQAYRLHHILRDAEAQILQETGQSFFVQLRQPDISVTVTCISAIVCNRLDIPEKQLLSLSRHNEVKEARHIVMYLCKKYIKNLTPAALGQQLKRERTTVMHAWKVIANRIACKDQQILQKLQRTEPDVALFFGSQS